MNTDGEVINVDQTQMTSMLSGAAEVISDTYGDKINQATKVVLTARTLEYGINMWQEGLRQGMLLGLKQSIHKD